jgi:hypothetical protein
MRKLLHLVQMIETSWLNKFQIIQCKPQVPQQLPKPIQKEINHLILQKQKNKN